MYRYRTNTDTCTPKWRIYVVEYSVSSYQYCMVFYIMMSGLTKLIQNLVPKFISEGYPYAQQKWCSTKIRHTFIPWVSNQR